MKKVWATRKVLSDYPSRAWPNVSVAEGGAAKCLARRTRDGITTKQQQISTARSVTAASEQPYDTLVGSTRECYKESKSHSVKYFMSNFLIYKVC